VLLAGDQLGLFDGVPVMDELPDEVDEADDLVRDALAATT
jgi:hypothetical protein